MADMLGRMCMMAGRSHGKEGICCLAKSIKCVTRAVFWAWNSSSIPLINYFDLEGLVGPFNL